MQHQSDFQKIKSNIQNIANLILIASLYKCFSFGGYGEPNGVTCLSTKKTVAVWQPIHFESAISTGAPNVFVAGPGLAEFSSATCVFLHYTDSVYLYALNVLMM